jgi:hypothetical protein
MVMLPPLAGFPVSAGRARKGWPYRQGWRSLGQRDGNEFHCFGAPGEYPGESLLCAARYVIVLAANDAVAIAPVDVKTGRSG